MFHRLSNRGETNRTLECLPGNKSHRYRGGYRCLMSYAHPPTTLQLDAFGIGTCQLLRSRQHLNLDITLTFSTTSSHTSIPHRCPQTCTTRTQSKQVHCVVEATVGGRGVRIGKRRNAIPILQSLRRTSTLMAVASHEPIPCTAKPL